MPSLNLIKIENVWFINIHSLFSALLLSMRLPNVSGINCLNSLLLLVHTVQRIIVFQVK